MNGIHFERVTSILYLGIYLDEDLSWRTHIDNTANKISKANGILRRLKFTVPLHIMKTLYYTLINPYLNYGLLAWGFKIERLQKLQKQSIRIITNSNFYAHTEGLFKRMKILKIEDMFDLKQLIFYKNFLHGDLPLSLQSLLELQNPDHRQCHSSFFLKPAIKTSTEMAKLCIRHSIPKFINQFDFEFILRLRDTSTCSIKNNFKKLVFSGNQTECRIENCFDCGQDSYLS